MPPPNEQAYLKQRRRLDESAELFLSTEEEWCKTRRPLYLEAAKKIMFPDSFLHDGVYFGLKDMEIKEFKVNKRPLVSTDWDEYFSIAESRAVSAASAIRKGLFPLAEGKCEMYCEFIRLCRGGRIATEEE